MSPVVCRKNGCRRFLVACGRMVFFLCILFPPIKLSVVRLYKCV